MKLLLVTGLTATLASASFATSITVVGVADDFFTAYLSTSPTVQGTQFANQTATWQNGTVTGTINLTPNVTNYVNIVARDAFGAPSMFIGSLSLSDAQFQFNDASQFIVSANNSNWTASIVGVGGTPTSINDLGGNGTQIWGNFGTLPSSARHIWTPGAVSNIRYFQVAVTPVPEPGTMLAFAGLAAIAAKRRRAR
ncbi:MAG: hypothetical protein Fur0036_02060 [Fimbriimonadaceae bacterium]